jgi:hypothetical protein
MCVMILNCCPRSADRVNGGAGPAASLRRNGDAVIQVEDPFFRGEGSNMPIKVKLKGDSN